MGSVHVRQYRGQLGGVALQDMVGQGVLGGARWG